MSFEQDTFFKTQKHIAWNIVLAYYQEGDLEQKLTETFRRKSLTVKSLTGKGSQEDEQLIIKWIYQLAQGIFALHEMGIMHRDLKPSNIFLEDGNLLIADFGSSKLGALGLTPGVTTPGYSAPEILNGKSYTNAVDMWALGSILVNLLTLCSQVELASLTKREKIKKIPTYYSLEWIPIVRALLKKDPNKRMDAKQLLACFEEVEENKGGKKIIRLRADRNSGDSLLQTMGILANFTPPSSRAPSISLPRPSIDRTRRTISS